MCSACATGGTCGPWIQSDHFWMTTWINSLTKHANIHIYIYMYIYIYISYNMYIASTSSMTSQMKHQELVETIVSNPFRFTARVLKHVDDRCLFVRCHPCHGLQKTSMMHLVQSLYAFINTLYIQIHMQPILFISR